MKHIYILYVISYISSGAKGARNPIELMGFMSITKFDNWKKKQMMQLCNDWDQWNIRIYGTKHMIVHTFLHVQVVHFFASKQYVSFQWSTEVDSDYFDILQKHIHLRWFLCHISKYHSRSQPLDKLNMFYWDPFTIGTWKLDNCRVPSLRIEELHILFIWKTSKIFTSSNKSFVWVLGLTPWIILFYSAWETISPDMIHRYYPTYHYNSTHIWIDKCAIQG